VAVAARSVENGLNVSDEIDSGLRAFCFGYLAPGLKSDNESSEYQDDTQ
jgi:hypothetical protein